jgi:hypothetical protein
MTLEIMRENIQNSRSAAKYGNAALNINDLKSLLLFFKNKEVC